MVVRLENVFSEDAVRRWGDIVRNCWAQRKSSPDGYLRCLPLPGARVANGLFTTEEESLFASRLEEFRSQNWPLTYWGIFSLALPHRTGEQCRDHYRRSGWFRPGEEELSRPLAAAQACLRKHQPQLDAAWAAPIAQQIESKVESYIHGSSIRPLNFGAAATPGTLSKGGVPTMTISPAVVAPQVQVQKPPPAAPLAQPPITTTEKIGPPKHPSDERARPPLKRKAGIKLQQPPPQHRSRPLLIQDEGSDDEFVAGSLRGVPSLPSTKLLNNANSGAQKKEKAPTGKRRGSAARGRRVPLASANFHVAVLDELGGIGGDEKLTIIRLDKQRSLLGWGRAVLPYCPLPKQPIQIPDGDAGRVMITTQSILSFDFSRLRGHQPFLGAIINAPLVEDTPETLQLDPCCIKGFTVNQLASLPLVECLADDAIVCVWAPKEFVGQVVRCMSTAWGCKYVENLTWVHLAPSGLVGRAPLSHRSRPFNRSHSTLIIGRRGGGDLELRHQRTADVVMAPALGGGRFPDAVREMLETLLPDGEKRRRKSSSGDMGGDGETSSGPEPRLLEVAFHGAEPVVRPGWVTLAQVNDA